MGGTAQDDEGVNQGRGDEEISQHQDDEDRESRSRFDHLERYPTDDGPRPE
jgi:hypothetical protein